jgi:hypothetical protein
MPEATSEEPPLWLARGFFVFVSTFVPDCAGIGDPSTAASALSENMFCGASALNTATLRLLERGGGEMVEAGF